MESLVVPASLPTADPQSKPVDAEVVVLPGGTQSVSVSTETPKAEAEAPKVDPNRPAWLPEKFKSPEDMAAAYKELEQKQGSPKPADPPATPTGDVSKISADEMSALSDEYAKDGKLSDATYQKLAEKGITKDVVDNHIEGQKARVQQYAQTLYESVGGKESFDKMSEWAGANLSQGEIDSLNKVISSGDAETTKMLLAGVKARYTAAVGVDPKLVNGPSTGGPAGVQPFGSMREITDAMMKPEYRTDPAYREKVEKRIAVTNQLRIS